MAKQRRTFTAEEKVSILRRHLLDGVAVSDPCDEHGLNPALFYRWQKTFFENGTPLNLEDARRIVADFVAYHNDLRLHSAIGCVAPKDRLEGRAEAIMADCGRKLSAARDARKARRRKRKLTERKKEEKLAVVGETDASSAGAQLARDSRPGGDEHRTGGAERSPACLANAG